MSSLGVLAGIAGSDATRMTPRFVYPKHKRTRVRAAHMAIASLAAVIAAGDHADAASGRKERAVAFVEGRTAGEPTMAIVSLHKQQITVYDANGWILRAPVSSGQKGHPALTSSVDVASKLTVAETSSRTKVCRLEPFLVEWGEHRVPKARTPALRSESRVPVDVQRGCRGEGERRTPPCRDNAQ
jgi:hypothetical protein